MPCTLQLAQISKMPAPRLPRSRAPLCRTQVPVHRQSKPLSAPHHSSGSSPGSGASSPPFCWLRPRANCLSKSTECHRRGQAHCKAKTRTPSGTCRNQLATHLCSELCSPCTLLVRWNVVVVAKGWRLVWWNVVVVAKGWRAHVLDQALVPASEQALVRVSEQPLALRSLARSLAREWVRALAPPSPALSSDSCRLSPRP